MVGHWLLLHLYLLLSSTSFTLLTPLWPFWNTSKHILPLDFPPAVPLTWNPLLPDICVLVLFPLFIQLLCSNVISLVSNVFKTAISHHTLSSNSTLLHLLCYLILSYISLVFLKSLIYIIWRCKALGAREFSLSCSLPYSTLLKRVPNM